MRNIDKRVDFVKKFGQEKFDKICTEDKTWANLKDIPVPNLFKWLFSQFLSIRQSCEYDFNGNIIFTPRTIIDYSECLGIEFSYREKQTLLAMNIWAEEKVREVRKKAEEE